MLRATVITDASFCHRYRAAGWAAWVVVSEGFDRNKRTEKRYGAFHRKPRNSTEAEKWACFNGLWLAARMGAEYALIQTDCLSVVNTKGGEGFQRQWDEHFPGLKEISWLP